MDDLKPTQPQSDEQAPIEVRIEKLKEQARALSGGLMAAGIATDCPPEVEEQFWKRVLEFENLPRVQPFDVLVSHGMSLPAPEELDEEQLTAKLRETIDGLADVGIFLNFTNHLSDRELYTRLWTETLREPTELEPDRPEAFWHVDMTVSKDDDGIETYLKYYAGEQYRRSWAQDWPDDPLPEATTPPYDRDRHLPQPFADPA